MNPYLNILISTYNDRIYQVRDVLLEPRPDVTYIISHQYTDDAYKTIPTELLRNDIAVFQLFGKGVTKSRNNVINLSNAPVSLFSDDDVKYTNEYLDTIIHRFKSDASIDVALFKIKTPEGCPEYKQYPSLPTHLTNKKLPFSVGTIEIAFRTESVKKKNVLFDERFGAGQPLLIGGDESIFITDCIKHNLNVWFFPEYIVEHPFESSIQLIPTFDKKRVAVMGASDARINGLMAIPKAFYLTIRLYPLLRKNRKKPLEFLRERLSAAMYIYRTNKSRFT